MKRWKRWTVLVLVLFIIGGLGLIAARQASWLWPSNDALATDKSAADDAEPAKPIEVRPIAVRPDDARDASPLPANPLRGAPANATVVRANDESNPAPASYGQVEQPEAAGASHPFAGRAAAGESQGQDAEYLVPPPTAQGAVAEAPAAPAAYYGDSGTEPAAAGEASPGVSSRSRFGSGEAEKQFSDAGTSRFSQPPPVAASGNQFSNEQYAAEEEDQAASAVAPPPRNMQSGLPPVGSSVRTASVGLADQAAALPPAASDEPAEFPAKKAQLLGEDVRQGTGQPGGKHLDGPQQPSVTVEKLAPPEIQIGKQAQFQIRIRNVGRAEADNVVVRDQIPKGTELIDTNPPAERSTDGSLVWNLGSLPPGGEKNVTLNVMPTAEGEVGSVASVTFAAKACARTVCTRPLLEVETSAPRQVLIGQNVVLTIRVSNPGSGAASHVILEEDVPEGLAHAAGQALEFEVGTLKPGESRELQLAMVANKAGLVRNVLRARADANLAVQSTAEIEVTAPQLAVVVDGPSKRYLEREATHTISVENPGTAPARNIEMVAHLPKGLKFVSTTSGGQYNPQTHTVHWTLEQLTARDRSNVTLSTLPLEPGDQKIRVESRADMNLTAAEEQVVAVEGLAALFFEVADAEDPIEVGGETIYEVRVVNQGSKTSANIRLVAALPEALQPIEAGGPTAGVINGQQVIFEPLSRLAPKADALYRIRVKGTTAGNQRVRVQLVSDEIPAGVTKEESTRVYSDQ